jgi:hypothetical protein
VGQRKPKSCSGEERRQADILVANDRVVDDVQCTISLRSAMGAAEGTSDVAFFRGAVVGVVALGVVALGGVVVAPAALA